MKRQAIVNPSVRGGRRIVNITDRALRYRANAAPPPGPRHCHYCGQPGGRIDVEHVDGREENSRPENLSFACRSCNTRKGAVFARAKIGRPTRQYNPGGANSLAQWKTAAAILTGRGRGNLANAIATVQATPPARRAKFAQQLNPAPPIPTFEQYVRALKMHRPKAHDDGGKIIHATPPSVRKEYQARINAFTAPQRRAAAEARHEAERARWD